MPRAAKGEPVRQAIECPRCGYDVTGTMSLWTESCPLEGRCTECGYDFQWKHLLGPNLGVPKWFFETARRRRVRAFIGTVVRIPLPFVLWDDVPLHARFNVWRMALIVALCAIAAYATSFLALIACDVLQNAFPHAGWSRWHRNQFYHAKFAQDPLRQVLRHLPLQRSAMWPIRGSDDDLAPMFEAVVWWNLIASGLVPFGFLAVSHTLRVHRVRFMHLLRGGAYSVAVTYLALGAWFAVAGAVLVRRLLALSRYSYGWRDSIGLEGMWVLWPFALAGWWWCVCAMYLRIRHAFWVAVLMTLMAYLAAAVTLYPVIMNPLTWYELSKTWYEFSKW